MRKITTLEEKEKRDTRNKVIIGLVLVALMIFSTAGYSFFSGSREEKEEIDYNGKEFVLEDNGFWSFNIENARFLTQYNPKETENISVPVFMTTNDYYGNPLYFSGQSSVAAKQEIARNLQNFASRMQDVCINRGDLECETEDLPTKDCSKDNIIIIKESEDIKVSQEEKCIFIFAPYEEQIRAADAFLFKILGISGVY